LLFDAHWKLIDEKLIDIMPNPFCIAITNFSKLRKLKTIYKIRYRTEDKK